MERFGDQWYVFYHRSTYGGVNSRHVCIEPVYFDMDGNIMEAQQTTSGVGDPIPAKEHLPANLACALTGHVRIEGDETSPENLVLAQIRNGDTATYRYLLFRGETSLSIRMKSVGNCRVELYLDGAYHAETLAAPSDTYVRVNMTIPAVSGDREVTLKFYGEFTDATVEAIAFS
jgi:hypothetical protein